jgi:hypothetical protein
LKKFSRRQKENLANNSNRFPGDQYYLPICHHREDQTVTGAASGAEEHIPVLKLQKTAALVDALVIKQFDFTAHQCRSGKNCCTANRAKYECHASDSQPEAELSLRLCSKLKQAGNTW